MLFVDIDLESEFDFGREVSNENASLKHLAKEIVRVAERLEEKNPPTRFRHTDNSDKALIVQFHHSKGEDSLSYRSEEDVIQLLDRKDRTSTISQFLRKLGIEKPEEGTSDFKEYLQLLYFFYMMRYFTFENDSFFRMDINAPTSELSPVKGASQGKYWRFILENLMDDEKACKIFICQDFAYSTMISIIANKINQYISENSFYDNERRAQEIEQIIERCNLVPQHDWNGGIILRAMDAAYQYQMLGYSGDMIRNLTKKERPFDFPELEINAPLEQWYNRFLRYEDIQDFLKEKEVAYFCRQRKDITRPDKALRNGPSEIVMYLFNEDKERANHLFVQEDEKGELVISALYAAVIAKTFLDLEKEKLSVDIKKKNGWDHEVSFTRSLSSLNGVSKSKSSADLAYRLFIVAFHSEYLNTTKGHGYYPVLFRPIYLRNYIYVQKCVNQAFSGKNPNEWRDRLQYFIKCLPYDDEGDF